MSSLFKSLQPISLSMCLQSSSICIACSFNFLSIKSLPAISIDLYVLAGFLYM